MSGTGRVLPDISAVLLTCPGNVSELFSSCCVKS
jgi:hypothetical protein